MQERIALEFRKGDHIAGHTFLAGAGEDKHMGTPGGGRRAISAKPDGSQRFVPQTEPGCSPSRTGS